MTNKEELIQKQINNCQKRLKFLNEKQQALLLIKNNLKHCCVYDNNLKILYEKSKKQIKVYQSYLKSLKKLN